MTIFRVIFTVNARPEFAIVPAPSADEAFATGKAAGLIPRNAKFLGVRKDS